jgi:ubiquinone/menaquinone biosynthesis C-methylase UbiE
MVDQREFLDFYEDEAEQYDESRFGSAGGALKHRLQSEALVSCLRGHGVESDDPILEVGCGTGRFLRLLSEAGFSNVHGIDQSRSMIESGRELGDAETVVGDAFRLPFEDDAFEVAYSIHVLMHLPDKRGFIDELKRVSERLVIFELNNERSLSGLAPLYHRLKRYREGGLRPNQTPSVGTIDEYEEYLSPWEVGYRPTHRLPLAGPMGERYYRHYPRLDRLYSRLPDRFASQLLLVGRNVE